MPSASEIFGTFPEFVGQDATQYLALAELEQADLWGDDRLQYAIAFRAAATMWGMGLASGAGAGSSGGVTSKRIGSLAVSYALPTGATPLSGNKYGQLLEAMLAGAVVGIVVSCGTCGCLGADCGHGIDPAHRASQAGRGRGWWPIL